LCERHAVIGLVRAADMFWTLYDTALRARGRVTMYRWPAAFGFPRTCCGRPRDVPLVAPVQPRASSPSGTRGG